MPDLSTDLHTRMLRESRRGHSLLPRLFRSIVRGLQPPVYGSEWGVIDDAPPLRFVLDRWVKPYVKSDQIAVEIGPGGGRWTQHLLGFKTLYAVDYYDDLLLEIKKAMRRNNNI